MDLLGNANANAPATPAASAAAISAPLARLIDQVRTAHHAATPLELRGAGTKRFYGEAPTGQVLDTRPVRGILSYQPTELVVTAACGTPLAELEAALAQCGQALAFEPPHFGPPGDGGGTVGGMVAAGLSGPARASAGAVRDHLLGATLLDGRGELMQFGGQVIKNVAGYDVSRLLAGSLGTLGVIVDVSLKVLPVAPATATLAFHCDEATALDWLNEWGGQPLPLNASAWRAGRLFVRLRGALAAVQAALDTLEGAGGRRLDPVAGGPLWQGLRHHTDAFFTDAAQALARGATLWRLSVPQTSPPLPLSGEQLIEWHGGQRWWCTAAGADAVRAAAARVGGHATRFRSPAPAGQAAPDVFAPLSPALLAIHRSVKQAFDPAGLFNPGRLSPHF